MPTGPFTRLNDAAYLRCEDGQMSEDGLIDDELRNLLRPCVLPTDDNAPTPRNVRQSQPTTGKILEECCGEPDDTVCICA